MTKLNFHVEAEINAQWVHAHVATLTEAKALMAAFEADDAVDVGVYLNADATPEARAEHAQYLHEMTVKGFQYLNEMVAQGKMTVENGVYSGTFAI